MIPSLIDMKVDNYLQFVKEIQTCNSHRFKFQIPHSIKNASKFSFFPRTARDWDDLPAELATITSPTAFKDNLCKFLD